MRFSTGRRHAVAWPVLAAAPLILAGASPASAQIDVYGLYTGINTTGPGQAIEFDTQTNAPIGSAIATGNGPLNAHFSPDGQFIYTADNVGNSVTVINALTRAPVATIAVGGGPADIAVSPDGKTLYVTGQNGNSVSIIDTTTRTVTGTVGVGSVPLGIALSADGKTAYVVNETSFSVSVVDTTTKTVTGTVNGVGTNGPYGIALSPDGTKAYVASQEGKVFVIDTATKTVIATIATGDTSVALGITPDGSKLYVGNQDNTITVISTATNTVLTTIAGAPVIEGAAATPDGTRVYVTGAAGISVIDPTTDTVTSSFGIPIASNGNIGTGFLGPNIIVAAGGPLSVASDAALASLGFGQFVDFNGGTLQLAGNLVTARTISLLTAGGTIDTNGFNATLSGSIVNSGSLTKAGAGILTLTGANSYSGGTVILGGLINFSAGGNLGTGAITLNGGGLQWASGNTLDISSRLAAIGSGGGSFDTNGNNVTLASVLSGGSITKQGAGTLTLSNVATYTGATTISGGTLALSSGGSIAASSGVSLAAPGAVFDISAGNQTIQDLSGVAGSTVAVGTSALTFGTGSATSFAGAFSGSGSLVWNGTGSLSLTGDSSGFAGTTTINAGTVALGTDSAPNARLGGDVTVAGGQLQGFGTIGGALANSGGIVRPGGSIGTLTVGGSYTQGSNGTLTIEVGPGAASQLKVLGSASLAGKLVLIFDPGVYTSAAYKLLTAASVGGRFATVTGSNPSGLAQSLIYDPGDVTLQLGTSGAVDATNDTVFGDAASIALLGAQRMNGMILDRLGERQAGIEGGEEAAAPGLVRMALAQSGDAAPLGELAAALPQRTEGDSWFRGIGEFASIDGTASAPGFSGSTGGFLAGYDRPLADDVYLGVAGGYLHSSVAEQSTSSGSQSSARLALYGGSRLGANLFTATVGYAHDWFSTARGIAGIGTASESHGGDEATLGAQWRRPLRLRGLGAGGATLTPKAGFRYLHLTEGGFSEAGASGFDLSSPGHDSDSLQPYVGAALAQTFVTAGGTVLVPELRIAYAHDLFNSRTLTVTTQSGAAFSTSGAAPSRDQVSAGLGLTLRAARDLSISADYDAVLPTGNTLAQTVRAGLSWRF